MSKQWVGLTGAAGGIGVALIEEVCEKFPECRVVGLDLNEDKLRDLEKRWPGKFLGMKVDLSHKENYLKVLECMFQEYGVPLIWFNNAGMVEMGPFVETGLEKFEKVMALNFGALLWGTHFWLGKIPKQSPATIVQLASMAGKVPSAFMSSYNASKFAVVGLTQSLQLELELEGSEVNMLLVTPGFVAGGVFQKGIDQGAPARVELLASSPESCAKEIMRAIERRDREVIPTISGKLLNLGQRLGPGWLRAVNLQSAKKMLRT